MLQRGACVVWRCASWIVGGAARAEHTGAATGSMRVKERIERDTTRQEHETGKGTDCECGDVHPYNGIRIPSSGGRYHGPDCCDVSVLSK